MYYYALDPSSRGGLGQQLLVLSRVVAESHDSRILSHYGID
jgi:hypothetical protein